MLGEGPGVLVGVMVVLRRLVRCRGTRGGGDGIRVMLAFLLRCQDVKGGGGAGWEVLNVLVEALSC